MITEIHGNLFDTTAPVIAHGVNCQGAFGSGVAGQIAKRWPKAKQEYMRRHHNLGWSLGQIQFVSVENGHLNGLVIANLATQDRYGRHRPGEPPFASLAAIEVSLRSLFKQCKGLWDMGTVAMPRIGCGLGGLRWDQVRPILVNLASEFDINVEVYNNDPKGTA